MIADPRVRAEAVRPAVAAPPSRARGRARSAAAVSPAPTAGLRHDRRGRLGEFLAGHATHHQHGTAGTARASCGTDADTAPPPTGTGAACRPRSIWTRRRRPALRRRPHRRRAVHVTGPGRAATAARASGTRTRARSRVGGASTPRIKPGERFLMSPTDPTVTLTRAAERHRHAHDRGGRVRRGRRPAARLRVRARVRPRADDADDAGQPLRAAALETSGARRRARPVRADAGRPAAVPRAAAAWSSTRSPRTRQPLTWGGTLVITTFGGGRIEISLDVAAGRHHRGARLDLPGARRARDPRRDGDACSVMSVRPRARTASTGSAGSTIALRSSDPGSRVLVGSGP